MKQITGALKPHREHFPSTGIVHTPAAGAPTDLYGSVPAGPALRAKKILLDLPFITIGNRLFMTIRQRERVVSAAIALAIVAIKAPELFL